MKSKSVSKRSGQMSNFRLSFKVRSGSTVSFGSGRKGYLIGKNNVRIPYRIIVCSREGVGVMEFLPEVDRIRA